MSGANKPGGPGSLVAMLRVQRIIHAGMMLSTLLYGVVLYLVAQDKSVQPIPTFSEMETLFYGLCGAAVFTLVVIVFLRGKLMPPQSEMSEPVPDGQLPNPARKAMMRLQQTSIVTWALAESIAIYGLVFGFLIREEWPIYPFGLATVALLMLFAPNRRLAEGVVRAALE